MSKKKGLWLALLMTVMLMMPTLANASIKRVLPKLLPVDNGSRADLAIKMNDELFNWIEDAFSEILNFEQCGPLGPRVSPAQCYTDEPEESPDDQIIQLQEILNEYIFGNAAVPGSTVEPMLTNPLLTTCVPDIPILGTICIGLYLRDNDVPPDQAVISFNSPTFTPFGLEIEGDQGAVYQIYTDDNLHIEIVIEEIEIDLQLDEPTDPSSIEFTYPDGSTGTCDQYRTQQWDSKTTDSTNSDGRCVTGRPAGTFGGTDPGTARIAQDNTDGYTWNCVARLGGPPIGGVWSPAPEKDMLCDFPNPSQASTTNGCWPYREDGDGLTPAYDTLGPASCAPNCPFYASECDLSSWISLAGDLTIGWDSDQFGSGAQDIRIGIGIRPIFGGNGTRTKANTAIGFELQSIDFGTNLVFELNVTIPTDHPQYELSADIDALLPAIDAVIRVYMEDLFKCDEIPPGPGDPPSSYPLDPNCIGYYLGPTRLIDIMDLLSGFLPMLHPLIPYISMGSFPPIPNGGAVPSFTGANGITAWPNIVEWQQYGVAGAIGAGINLDLGIVSDWMAEQTWGAMMPANLFLDVQMVFMDASTDPPVPFTDPATNYGYIPYPSCVYQYDGRIGDAQQAAYPGRFTPNPATVTVPFQQPMFCDPPNSWSGGTCTNSFQEAAAPGGNYYSDNDGGGPVIFDESVADRYHVAGNQHMHFLQGDCNPELGPLDPPGADGRGPCSGDYMMGIGMHQDVVSELVYGLVSSGVLCLTIDPTEVTGNTILDMFSGESSGGTGTIDLSSFLTLSTGNTILAFLLPALPESFGSDAPIIIKIVPYTVDPKTRSTTFKHIPRAWTGGRITEVIDNQYSPATNPAGVWYEPTQWQYGAQNFAFENPEIDLQIDIPHLLIEFWTKECSGTWTQCQLPLTQRPYNAPQRVFALDLGVRMGMDMDILSPMPSPMTFPSGGVWNVTTTGRTFFMGMVLDPNVKMFFSYLEQGVHTHPCVDSDHPVCGGTTGSAPGNNYNSAANDVYQVENYSLANLENYMGNLLTTIMSLIAQFELRLTIDLGSRGIGAALPPIPISINGSIEPSCNDAEEGVIANCPSSTDADPSEREGYGSGDYLQIYLDIVGDLPVYFVMQFLTCALLPDDPSCADFAFNIEDLLGGLGLAPPGAPGKADVLFETPDFDPPKTTILPITNPNPFETVVYFQAKDNETPAERLRYSWRLDGSAWRPFLPLNYAVLRGLGDGVHTFEVRAIDDQKYVEAMPAKMTFVVDGMGPDIYLEGDKLTRVETRNPVFFARAFDHVYRDEVEIAYSIDGQDYVPTDGEIQLSGLSDGSHILNIKAADPQGNVSMASHSFVVAADSDYGCSSTPMSGLDLGLLLLLALPPVVLLRRKAARR